MLGIIHSVLGLSVAAKLVLLSPMPADLVERIRGQSSDLAWTIELIQLSEAQQARPWKALKAHPRAAEFDLAAWVETASGAEERLSIYNLRSGRYTVKPLAIHRNGPGHERSAHYETVAILLRGHLKIFALAVKPARPAPVPKPPPPPLVRTATKASTWSGRILFQHRLRGFRARGTPGLFVGLGRSQVRWAWCLGLSLMLPEADRDEYATLELQQYGVQWRVYHDWLNGPSGRLGGQINLGVEAYLSRLTEAESTVQPKDAARLWAGQTGFDLVWQTPPLGLFDGLGFQINLGADVVWGAPEYQYATENGTQVRNVLASIQPHLGFGLFWGK
jgi:hypothetical protein